ncbi:ABC transporter permease [Streptosporangium saharense]|uniref:Peptide/nickel transport system permease protein n=1 Tax=Streptosporangium saharense TaxID=1706840 RepID=A0A7W7QUJ8_9ACTN|nr:ABC transporter permease [Streptosporangium saharense]MBB4919989.1 peptide/nickel transport system permease protein [Streptosporangium saharense]
MTTPPEPPAVQHTEPVPPGVRDGLRRAGRSLLRDVPALISVAVLVLLLLAALLAPLLAPHDPMRTYAEGLSARGAPVPPGGDFPLGTDPNGRDVLSRLLYGARVSLTIGVVANGLATLVGVTAGVVAGYFGGLVDTVISRITDMVMSFPILLFCVALISVTGPSQRNVVLVIALVYWTYLARVIRGMVLSLREREFVTATRTLGVGDVRIMVRHILPHLIPAIIVYATLGVASSILIESSLSFIGVGVPVPEASWGQMIDDGRRYYEVAPWLLFAPGLCLIATVLAFNLAGDWLRDLLDPTAPERR